MPISIPSGKTDRPASKPETHRDERPVSVPVDHATFNDEAVKSAPRRVTSSTVSNMDEDELDRLLGIGDGGNEGSVAHQPETVARPAISTPVDDDDSDDLSDMLPPAPSLSDTDPDDDLSDFGATLGHGDDSDNTESDEEEFSDFGSYSKARGDVSTIEADEDEADEQQTVLPAVDDSDNELDSLLGIDHEDDPSVDTLEETDTETEDEDPLARFNRIIAETEVEDEGEDGDDDVDIFADGDEGDDDSLDYETDADDDSADTDSEFLPPVNPYASTDEEADTDDDDEEYDLEDAEEEEESPVVFAPLSKKSPKNAEENDTADSDEVKSAPQSEKSQKPPRFGGLKGRFASIKEQVLADARGEDPAKAAKTRPAVDDEDEADDGKQEGSARKKGRDGSSAVKKTGAALLNNPIAKLIRTLLSPVAKLWMLVGSILVKVITVVVGILAKLPIIGKFIAPFLKATRVLNWMKGLLPLLLILGLLFWTGQKDVPLSSSVSLPDNGSVSFDSFGYDGATRTAHGTVHNTGDVIADVKVSFTVDTVHPTLNPFTWFAFRPSGTCATKPVSLDIDVSKTVSVTCENVSGLFPKTSGVIR